MTRRTRNGLLVAVPLALLAGFFAWAVSTLFDPAAADGRRAAGATGGKDDDARGVAVADSAADAHGPADPAAGDDRPAIADPDAPPVPHPTPGSDPADPVTPADPADSGDTPQDPLLRDLPTAPDIPRPPRGHAGNGAGSSKTWQRPQVRDNLFQKRTRRLREFAGSGPDASDDGPVGLLGSYFQAPDSMRDHGANFPTDEEYAATPLRFARLDPTVHFLQASAFAPPGQPVPPRLLVRWDGFLNVREPGDYAFFVGCTGLAELHIDGQPVYRHGTHVFYEDFVTIALPEGLLPFRMQWFHYRRDPQVQLRYYTPHDMAVLRSVATAPDGEQQHVAEAGDTPALVAERYYGVADFADLILQANPDLVAADQPLEPGTSVVVPPMPLERVPFAPVVVPATFFRPPPTAVPPAIDVPQLPAGAVGEEIRIRGRHFASPAEIVVDFAGQPAVPHEGDATMLVVTVPIGAKTGELTVRQGTLQSNAVPFTCTTVFGLLGAWFDQSDASPGFAAADASTVPDDVHVAPVGWSSRSQIDSPLRNRPFAMRQQGELGVPVAGLYRMVLATDERARVTIGQQPLLLSTDGVPASAEVWMTAGRHPILIEAVDTGGTGGESRLSLQWQRLDGDVPDAAPAPIRQELFFAPINTARPDIVDARWNGEFGPAEGETFQLVVVGLPENNPVEVFVDGIPAEAKWVPAGDVDLPLASGGGLEVIVPRGVGNGRVTVRHAYVMSEPVTIPIRNVGLLGRYYDFPEQGFPAGWPPGFPQDRPISFMRQDRTISFDGTGEFDLPFSETFGATWHGTIRIDAAGVHRFWLGGDDGMGLFIGEEGSVFTLDDGGALHPYQEISGEVELQPGEYPIRLKFWENRGAEILRLFWQPPGGQREIVPQRVLRMPADWVERYHEWQAALNAGGSGSGSGSGSDSE